MGRAWAEEPCRDYRTVEEMDWVIIFLLSLCLLSIYVFLQLKWKSSLRLPRQRLPASLPCFFGDAGVFVHALETTRLSKAFYDREAVDASSIYNVPCHDGAVRHAPGIFFVAHISRSGSTLLSRLLEPFAVVLREPRVLTRSLLHSDRHARGVLRHFSRFAGSRKLIIKLPSVLSDSKQLALLGSCCPDAITVGLRRDLQDVAASHARTETRVDEETLRARAQAIAQWASDFIDYEDVVGDCSQLCRIFSIPRTPQISKQFQLVQKMDAKSDEPSIFKRRA